VRVLLIGYSRIARRRVLPALRAVWPGAHLSIASRSATPDASEAAVQWYDSYDDGLAAGGDLAYISLHNSGHVESVRKALEAGFHVLVDKPAFPSAAITRELLALAASRRRLLSEATVFPFHPQIGAVLTRMRAFGQQAPRVSGCFSIPSLPGSDFRNRPELGGGGIEDLGPYAVATNRLIFRRPPDTVSAVAVARRADGLITAVAILFGHGERGAMVGHFGFGTEYRNRLEIVDVTHAIEVHRAYTMPPEAAATISIVHQGSSETLEVPPADAFAEYFKVVDSALTSGVWAHLTEAVNEDADLLDRVRRAAAQPCQPAGA
jgi:dTDP-3,4-didehydro-2,6-dideoxy-alpha-D-glucose 3-reductase